MALIETVAPAKKSRTTPHLENGSAKPKKDLHSAPDWKSYEKVLFRFLFIYFALQVVPLDWKYYRDVFSLDWTSLHFSNLYYLVKYVPRFFGEVPLLLDWLVIAAIALVGTVAWGIVDNKNKEYNQLYYWLRVALRYRLAAALIAYAFIKIFPMQMPEPSISNLNTNYGDITDWKVFSMSTGIVPGYESFLGWVELSAALLLLHRKTASIGAFIILPFTGNVVMSNLAYEGGEYVYSLLLVSIALFLFVYDVQRLLSLTSFEKTTFPPRFKPSYDTDWLKNARIIAKSVFVWIFVFFYGYKTYASYRDDVYQFPNSKGLANASGIYNVSVFRLNGKDFPYSATDPVRWKDVVFEKWATLSVRSNKPASLTTASTEEIFTNNEERIYEFSGIKGRHYYAYTIDSVNHKLLLQNRSKDFESDRFALDFERPAEGKIILSGVDANNDSLYVELDKLDKKYLLEEAAKQGRRRGLKL